MQITKIFTAHVAFSGRQFQNPLRFSGSRPLDKALIEQLPPATFQSAITSMAKQLHQPLSLEQLLYGLIKVASVTAHRFQILRAKKDTLSAQQKTVYDNLLAFLPSESQNTQLDNKVFRSTFLAHAKTMADELNPKTRRGSQLIRGVHLSNTLGTLLNEFLEQNQIRETRNTTQFLEFLQTKSKKPSAPLELKAALASLNKQKTALKKALAALVEEDSVEDFQNKLELKRPQMTQEQYDKTQQMIKKLARGILQSTENGLRERLHEILYLLPFTDTPLPDCSVEDVRAVLDADHYGLEGPKRAILNHMVTEFHKRDLQKAGKQIDPNDMRPEILYLVGPPGTGKTSLGKSIAKATGRELVRISLGGVNDPHKIQGFLPTYSNSEHGSIIQALIKAKTRNPLILLDEVDKMGESNHNQGDPAAALLEALDPEQNSTFQDNHLGIPVDLSQVKFICTANSYNIPGPLKDRMNIVPINGYTIDEKLEIAKRHLIPRIRRQQCLTKELLGTSFEPFQLSDKTLRTIIRDYAPESGVRQLELCIEEIAQTVLSRKKEWLASGRPLNITPQNLAQFLKRDKDPLEQVDPTPDVGHINGLYFSDGGERSGGILPIDVTPPHVLKNVDREKAGLVVDSITGNMAKEMEESVKQAIAYVKSHADHLGLTRTNDEEDTIDLRKDCVHIDIGTSGLEDKDGPSAGAAITTAIISRLRNLPIPGNFAMTGASDLRGKVLPIAGVRKKISGSFEQGVTTYLIPEGNKHDIPKIPKAVLKRINIATVRDIPGILQALFPGKFPKLNTN
jgi:ATP-dependent Lon protease